MEDKTILKTHPSMFRTRPLTFTLCLLLVALYGLGLVLLLIWWFMHTVDTLIISEHRTTLRRGIFSRHITEIYHSHLRNIQISQSFYQRLFNVGTIRLDVSGQGCIEIVVHGIAKPYKVKGIIEGLRYKDEERALSPVS